jgi:pimeloyl-ACP methyl ester carboxylesterase
MLDVIDKGRETPDHPYPLLFVHGAFQGAWCWDVNFLDFFAERGFRAVAVSFRGHSSSTLDKPLRLCSIADYADDVASTVETLRRPILIGHSMGGFVVQKYLEDHDAPAAVLLASVPPHGHLPSLLRLIRRHPWRCAKFTLTGSPRDLTRGTTAGSREYFFGHTAPDTLVATVTDRLQRESTRAILVVMVAASLIKPARIDTPMLVLGAELDALYTNAEVRQTARTYATEAVIVSQMGHEMMLEPGWDVVGEHILSWFLSRGL